VSSVDELIITCLCFGVSVEIQLILGQFSCQHFEEQFVEERHLVKFS